MAKKFSLKKLIAGSHSLPLGSILFPKTLVSNLVASFVMPNPELPDIDVAQWRRAFMLNLADDHKKMLEPSHITNRQPFCSMMACIIAAERFLQLSLKAKLDDPFEHFGLDDGVYARWGGGLNLPDFSQRQKVDHELQKLLENPRLTCFAVPGDEELERLGYLSRLGIPEEDRFIFVDSDRLGGDPRLRLTQKALSWPLCRYTKVKRKGTLDGRWIYQVQVNDMKAFIKQSLTFFQTRYKYYCQWRQRSVTLGRIEMWKEKLNVQSNEDFGW